MVKVTKHFEDIRFTVTATLQDAEGRHIDFVVYEIAGTDAETNELCWNRKGATSLPDPVDTLCDAQPFLHGFVKWDGCSNWSFDQQDEGMMLHGCCRNDLTRIGEVMGRCWDITKDMLSSFEGDIE